MTDDIVEDEGDGMDPDDAQLHAGRERTQGRIIAGLALALVVAMGIAWLIGRPGTPTRRAAATTTTAVRPAPHSKVPPVVGDQWFAAYGVSQCGTWLPDLPRPEDDQLGVVTTGDGLINIHPFVDAAAGRNATLGLFDAVMGVKVDATSVRSASGWGADAVAGCGGKPARLVIEVWSAEAVKENAAPVVVPSPNDVVFVEDGMAVVMAVIPDGGPLTDLPPSVAALATSSDDTTATVPSPDRSSDSTGVHPYTVPRPDPRSRPYPAVRGLYADPVVVKEGDFGGLLVGRSLRAQLTDAFLTPLGSYKLRKGSCTNWSVMIAKVSLDVVTKPGGDSSDTILSIQADSSRDNPWWQTPEGIQAGSSLKELRNAYGARLTALPMTRLPAGTGEFGYVAKGNRAIIFRLVDGKVRDVIVSERPQRGADGDVCR